MLIRLGLMDRDERYIEKLAAYFSAHPEDGIQLELCLFASAEECNSYLRHHGRLDILLAAPALLPDPAVLESQPVLAWLGEDKSMQAKAGRPVICKYQKASAILRSIQGLAADIRSADGSYSLGERGNILLFVGASGGVGCATTAMACATYLAAQGKRVAYFSLRADALPELYFTGHGASMSDVHYCYQEWRRMTSEQKSEDDRLGLQLKVKSLLATDGRTRVDSFAGYALPLDALDVSGEESAALVQALAAQYDYCVADAPAGLSDALLQVLPSARWLVAVSDGKPASNQKLARLLDSLRELNSSQGSLLGGETGVLYNQFGSHAQYETNLPDYAKKLGEFPRYSNADQNSIIAEIAKAPLFAALEG